MSKLDEALSRNKSQEDLIRGLQGTVVSLETSIKRPNPRTVPATKQHQSEMMKQAPCVETSAKATAPKQPGQSHAKRTTRQTKAIKQATTQPPATKSPANKNKEVDRNIPLLTIIEPLNYQQNKSSTTFLALFPIILNLFGNSHRIITKTPEDYSTAKKILKENNNKFFT